MHTPVLVLTPKAASVVYGVSRSLLAHMRQQGTMRRPNLPVGPSFIRVGRKILYRQIDLDTWLASLPGMPAPTIATADHTPHAAPIVNRQHGEG